jgi:hypothetical protein
MNPEIKAQWLTDLRSGDFEKGTGKLHKVASVYDYYSPSGRTVKHTFCCLGVLAEQAVAAGVARRELVGSEENGSYRYFPVDSNDKNEANSNYLPACIQDWAGLTTANPRVVSPEDLNVGEVTVTLGSLNDDYLLSFEPIAAIVETDL